MFYSFKLYNLKKEFLLLVKSNFFLVLFFTIIVYTFFYYFIFNIKIKIYIEADERIKKMISAFLVNKDKNIVLIDNLNISDLILTIDTKNEIWEVNIKVNNLYSTKLIPVINYILFKVYFSFYNKIEPINFYIDLPKTYINMDNFKIDTIFSMIKNFMVWILFSYLFFDIYSEKKNKTILIYLYNNNLLNFIFSKVFLLSFIFVFVLLVFSNFMGLYFSIFLFLLVILNFILLCFILAILALIIHNKYYLNLINMFLGIISILFSTFNQEKLSYFFIVFYNNFSVFKLDYFLLILYNLLLIVFVIFVFTKFRNFILLKILKEVD